MELTPRTSQKEGTAPEEPRAGTDAETDLTDEAEEPLPKVEPDEQDISEEAEETDVEEPSSRDQERDC